MELHVWYIFTWIQVWTKRGTVKFAMIFLRITNFKKHLKSVLAIDFVLLYSSAISAPSLSNWMNLQQVRLGLENLKPTSCLPGWLLRSNCSCLDPWQRDSQSCGPPCQSPKTVQQLLQRIESTVWKVAFIAWIVWDSKNQVSGYIRMMSCVISWSRMKPISKQYQRMLVTSFFCWHCPAAVLRTSPERRIVKMNCATFCRVGSKMSIYAIAHGWIYGADHAWVFGSPTTQ